jgi:hypothetical protein
MNQVFSLDFRKGVPIVWVMGIKITNLDTSDLSGALNSLEAAREAKDGGDDLWQRSMTRLQRRISKETV